MGQDDQVRQGADPDLTGPADPFERMQAEDLANEVRVLWSEVAVIAVLALLAAVWAIVA